MIEVSADTEVNVRLELTGSDRFRHEDRMSRGRVVEIRNLRTTFHPRANGWDTSSIWASGVLCRADGSVGVRSAGRILIRWSDLPEAVAIGLKSGLSDVLDSIKADPGTISGRVEVTRR